MIGVKIGWVTGCWGLGVVLEVLPAPTVPHGLPHGRTPHLVSHPRGPQVEVRMSPWPPAVASPGPSDAALTLLVPSLAQITIYSPM